MRWIIKIEENKAMRIVVRFSPLDETLSFSGEIKHNMDWFEFCVEKHPMKIDLDEIQRILFNVHKTLSERASTFIDLHSVFRLIETIAIEESGEIV